MLFLQQTTSSAINSSGGCLRPFFRRSMEPALVHLKDMQGSQSVPFGKGDVDIAALIRAMDDIGYQGNYVVEIAPVDRENTFEYIKDAFRFLSEISE